MSDEKIIENNYLFSRADYLIRTLQEVAVSNNLQLSAVELTDDPKRAIRLIRCLFEPSKNITGQGMI